MVPGAIRPLKRSDRVDDLFCGDNGIGIIRNINLERSVHLPICVIRRCILHHCHMVSEFGCITNGRFDASMGDKPNDDQLAYAVLPQQKIQVRVGESTGTPMLGGDNLTRLGAELGPDFATPCSKFKKLAVPVDL
jgi:hypothetical protein